ncbi:Retrovirus-related Pol polyprotein from transposon RE2 [Sesamum angolense]|uniref:Retrovirus-related Pol polyprotein from transposon RE2 n=1 Tax=Sesamum angolense TaxID=2727404 RepID=A0AAE1X4C1_9LAMI|nr:Retrovirus-related Pol polyprotein from transposon RE2 [Sesamum angolense]
MLQLHGSDHPVTCDGSSAYRKQSILNFFPSGKINGGEHGGDIISGYWILDNAVMQDQKTKYVITVGKLYKHLYVLDMTSFNPATLALFTAIQHSSCINYVTCNNDLRHRQLGHPSLLVLKHIPQVESTQPLDTCMEPRNYVEAKKSAEWVNGMIGELTALDKQLDVNNTFLHRHLDEEVFMTPLECYSTAAPSQFCKSKRSLYGLKQASHQWNTELITKLQEFGYVQCPHDHYLFMKITDAYFVSLLVYVDDILLTGNSTEEITTVKIFALFVHHQRSGIRKYFLGLELARFWISLTDPGAYRRLVGLLLYLGFISNTLQPSFYTYASWASFPDSKRSITSFCIFLGSTLVSWKTKKQPTISRFSAEVEYCSLGAVVCKLLWLSYLLRALHIPFTTPFLFWCDNRAAIHITVNPVFHERTKHLDIDFQLVCDQFKLRFIQPFHVPSREKLANLFAKPFSIGDFSRLFVKLGLAPQAPPCWGVVAIAS